MTGMEFRKWRRIKEITQQEVAKSIECNQSTICRWEQEKINIEDDLYNEIMEFVQSVQD